jgi:pyrroloquinoline quinone biosynthesis protein B
LRLVRILGSAAGGGLPQWNCSCANCAAARAGKIPSQTQSSIAISADDQSWFLINASPDLSRQIEMTPALQPRHDLPRNSPIAAILLTNADLDHALGLVLMRQQATPLVVYATNETQAALGWIDILLRGFCGIEWRTIEPSPGDFVVPLSLRERVGVRVILLHNSVAFQFRDENSGATALVAPAVGELNDALREAANNSDVVLFDGTFWSNDELRAVRPGARSARAMNHLPISDGSLDFLRDSPARRKIYTHINNTNPILMPGSSERKQVEQAGIEIACDGLEIVL